MGWYNFNVDAACFDSGGAVSMVRRDCYGRFIGGSIRRFQALKDPGVLEAIAIREALSWIKARRLRQIIIRIALWWCLLLLEVPDIIPCLVVLSQIVLICLQL